MPTQSLQQFGLAPEVTFGTFVPPTKFIPGACTVNPTNTVTAPAQSRGSRSQIIDVVTAHTVSVQISAELTPEVISTMIAGWFGTGCDTVTGSSGTGFTHTLLPKGACPSYSVELDSDEFTHILAEQVCGNIIDQMTFTYQAQQIVTTQFQTVAQRLITPTTPGTPSNPTPTFNTLQPMTFDLLGATVNGAGTTQLISATLTCSNQTQSVASSNGQLYVTRLQPTQRSVTFSTTLDFMDSSLFTTAFQTSGATPQYSQTKLPIVLTLTTANNIPTTSQPYVVAFTLPNLRARDGYAISSASDVLQQQLSWSVTQGASASEISAVIINSESSALA